MWDLVESYALLIFRPFSSVRDRVLEIKSIGFYQAVATGWLCYTLMISFSFLMLVILPGQSESNFSSNLGPEIILILCWMLVKVVFFPLGRLILNGIYIFLIKTFNSVDEQTMFVRTEDVKCCLTHAFCADGLFLVPILGGVAQRISFMVNLYAGLRERLGYDWLPALFIVVCPILFTVFVLFFSFNFLLVLALIFF